MITQTPSPPYYAVIFSSIHSEDTKGYGETAKLLEELAKKEEGYLGLESARNEIGITVSYWKDLESIKTWKENVVHKVAQEKGKENWYKNYKVRIALVEREYGI